MNLSNKKRVSKNLLDILAIRLIVAILFGKL